MSFFRRYRKPKIETVSTGSPIRDTGLTLVSDPEARDIEVDVIFVHGFTGHPEKTWTLPGGRARASTFWPRDKLPLSLPKARVWTFGYDTKFNHPFRSANQNTVYGEGKELVASLHDVRSESETQLPIIFVAHSLGGIIVKHALRYAERCKAQRANKALGLIVDSVIGILFFGTPHGGADPRDLNHHILQSLAGTFGVTVNPNTLVTLLPNSAELEQLRDEFLPFVRQNQWVIFSFQEQKGVPFLNGKLVVEKASSCLGDRDIEITRAIDRNHMDMCKFSQQDPEYCKVDQALKYIWKCSSKQSPADRGRNLSEAQRQLFLSTLWWSEMNSRENAIEDPSIETVQWIFHDTAGSSYAPSKSISVEGGNSSKDQAPYFLEGSNENKHSNNLFTLWLASSESLFWIRGKAGCGKSTMMKFLSHDYRTKQHLRRWRPSVTILRFFFIQVTVNPLQKQVEGCLRSFLYQLLDSGGMAVCKPFQYLSTKKTSEHDWSPAELERTLLNTLANSDKAFCVFVDGLDEIQDKDQSSAIRLVKTLANIRNVKVCTSSREENAFLDLQIYPSVRIQDLSRNGILAYARRELYPRFELLGNMHDRAFCFKVQHLIKTLVEKGDGIFLWIRLVIRSLERGIGNGDSFETLLKRIEEFAPSLDGLFEQMWSRQNLDYDIYRQESAELFWSVLDAHHESNWWTTSFIGNLFLTNILIREDIMGLFCAGQMPKMRYVQSAMKKHARWLSARGAGLIELQHHVASFLEHGDDNTLTLPIPKRFDVRFIHKSAREYLLNTQSGREILDHDTRQPQDKWWDVVNALKATAIFSIVYKSPIFNYFEWGIPSLLPENTTTYACSSFTGLLACHAAMGHMSTSNELALLNDFARIVRAVARPRKLQFPIFMCAAAYGTSHYLSQNCGRMFDELTADEKNTILFSACDSFQIHVRLSEDIPAEWENIMELEECNCFAIKMIRRSIASIKYMLLAGANPDAVFSSRIHGGPRYTTPFLTFLHQLFLSISDIARHDFYPEGLWENKTYVDELKSLYTEIGTCLDGFANNSKLKGSVILDHVDYGHFCWITKPKYSDFENIFEISINWFVEFFQARRAFFENTSYDLERPEIHGLSQYVKCITLRKTEAAGPFLRSKDEVNVEALRLEQSFEALLWNRASWRYQKGRFFPAQNRELDKTFESLRDYVLDEIYL